ncbi:unnamed protein product, partial [Sphacelaria rigidula]
GVTQTTFPCLVAASTAPFIPSATSSRFGQATGTTAGNTCPSSDTFGNAANVVSGAPYPPMSLVAPTVLGEDSHSANPSASGRGGPAVC